MTIDHNAECKEDLFKKETDDLKGSIALYSTGALPVFIPGLHLYGGSMNQESASSSMENLKVSFEEWRSFKEDEATPDSETLPLEIFEGSLYDVIGSLDQDVFQKRPAPVASSAFSENDHGEHASALSSSPPCSLSERISMLLDRVKELSSVFRDRVAFWKNAVSVWLFDSLLSPSWQEFLGRMEDALSTSVSSLFGLKEDQSKQAGSPRCLNDEHATTGCGLQQKSRFEYVPPNSISSSPMASIAVGSGAKKGVATKPTVLPNLPSVSSIFKDFAQPILSSTASVSSLFTTETEKTAQFFTGSEHNNSNIPRPAWSPRYVTPAVPKNQSVDPDWYLKWTRNPSITSLSSTPSSGVEKLESLTAQPESDTPNGGYENPAQMLGFETIE